jgi:hypoxanthine phosphoribosyltransferase
MSNLSFHKLSFTDLQKDCIELYNAKLKDLKIDQIVSICRGGDVVSRIFSDLFSNAPISHITITSYKDLSKQKTPVITEEPQKDMSDKVILLVDEVSDTGVTFDIVKDYFLKRNVKKIYTLSPYIKPHTKHIPDYYLKKIDGWIVFPYDLRETYDGFVKMFGSDNKAKDKMLEIGFSKWEVDSI